MRWVRALSQEVLPEVKRCMVTTDGAGIWIGSDEREAASQPAFKS